MAIVAKDHKAERDRLFYNLKKGERARLRAFQGNRDPITGEPLSEHAHVDHDHRTGLIRGLLNPLTNKFLIDDIERLQASIDYLKHPPAVSLLGPVYGLIGKAQKKKKMLYGPAGSPEPQPRPEAAVTFEEIRRGE